MVAFGKKSQAFWAETSIITEFILSDRHYGLGKNSEKFNPEDSAFIDLFYLRTFSK